MGQACTDNRTTIEKQMDSFLKMMRTTPNLKRYTYNKTHQATYLRAWANPQFGGNVFKPLGSIKKNDKGKMVA